MRRKSSHRITRSGRRILCAVQQLASSECSAYRMFTGHCPVERTRLRRFRDCQVNAVSAVHLFFYFYFMLFIWLASCLDRESWSTRPNFPLTQPTQSLCTRPNELGQSILPTINQLDLYSMHCKVRWLRTTLNRFEQQNKTHFCFLSGCS